MDGEFLAPSPIASAGRGFALWDALSHIYFTPRGMPAPLGRPACMVSNTFNCRSAALRHLRVRAIIFYEPVPSRKYLLFGQMVRNRHLNSFKKLLARRTKPYSFSRGADECEGRTRTWISICICMPARRLIYDAERDGCNGKKEADEGA